ncbi:hypothetical protein, partial [Paenibacillus sp. GM1FR]|uniref:hypothetical protein n=1 Tax=Paenibacillus sp. GM1FR TaxID=2059267 RepID=UPI001A9C36F9
LHRDSSPLLCSSEMVVFLLSILTYDVQQYGGLFFAVTFIIASALLYVLLHVQPHFLLQARSSYALASAG